MIDVNGTIIACHGPGRFWVGARRPSFHGDLKLQEHYVHPPPLLKSYIYIYMYIRVYTYVYTLILLLLLYARTYPTIYNNMYYRWFEVASAEALASVKVDVAWSKLVLGALCEYWVDLCASHCAKNRMANQIIGWLPA